MSELKRKPGVESDAELEQLLSHASPRATPDADTVAAARSAVHDEWRTLLGRRRRENAMRWVVAATVLVTAFSVFSIFQPTAVVQVAEIQKSFGAVYILGDQSALTRTDDLKSIHSGQTIVTEMNAGLALAWGDGGSVRIAENSKVEFRTARSVFLHAGQIYFDSTPSTLLARSGAAILADFVIETEFGVVSHQGTQFTTAVEPDKLTVSVREGRVVIAGTYHDVVAETHERVTIEGRHRPVTTGNHSGYGADWSWIAKTSPPVDVDGKSIDEFLVWVSRELGMTVEYVGDAKQVATGELLRGRVDREPSVALLGLRMDTTVLQHEVIGGVIYVSSGE